jgi:cytochrome P450 family 628
MDSILYPVAALAGIATHLGYFIRGEHHMAGPKLIPFYLSLYALLCLILHQFGGISIHQSITMASVAAASYLTALFASMLVYRAFFHPLRGFKGHFASRLSNLYHVSHLGKLDNYKFVDRLHKQYGDIVRTGTCPLPSLYRPLLNPI